MLRIENLNISFQQPLFVNQSLEIKNNCLTLIVGESGCGKTTLLYKLGIIDFTKKDCYYYVDDTDISSYRNKKKTYFRRYNIAFVFQDYILYDHFNVYENIQYYASLVGYDLTEEKVKEYLCKVHLDVPMDRPLYTLSGGQKQRLAIACALTKEAPILILDEPTSALDIDNAKIIFQILSEIAKEKTVIMTSHNKIAFEYCDEVIEIKDGIITKVKSQSIQEERMDIISKKKFLPFQTYSHYIKKQYNFSKKIKMLIALVNVFIIIFCLGVSQITTNYIEQNKSIISADNPGWIYVPSLKEKDIEKMKVDKSYPFYNISLTLLGESYPVIPYYDDISINDKIWTRFDLSKEKGFYFSHSLFYKNNQMIVPSQYVNFFNSNTLSEVPFIYKGILLKNVKTEYTDKSEFIFMYHQLIEDKLNPSETSGYTLLCHSYDNFMNTKKILEDGGYQFTVFEEYFEIENYIEMLNTIQQTIMACIVLFGIITLYFLYNSYFNTRKKEFALLKCMGLTTMNISRLVFFEAFVMNIIGFIMVVASMLWFIEYSFIQLCLFEVGLLLSVYLIIILMVFKIKPIKVFRK